MNYNYKVNNLEDGTCCRWIKFQIEKNEYGKYINLIDSPKTINSYRAIPLSKFIINILLKT